MDLGRCSGSVKFLIRDGAGQFTAPFDAVFQAGGIRILASPPQAPRANAICERVTVTLRRELPGRLLLVDEHHLRRVLPEDLRHCNTARPHRALSKLAPAQARVRPPEINLAAHRNHRNQCSAGLSTSTRSPPDSCRLSSEEAGHRHGHVFEPDRLAAEAWEDPRRFSPAGARHGAQEQGTVAFTDRRA